MADTAKRLLNLVTLILIIFIVLVVITLINEGFTRAHSIPNLGIVALGIFVIAATNYVAFGKTTLWNRINRKI